jgi:hypothetical protein
MRTQAPSVDKSKIATEPRDCAGLMLLADKVDMPTYECIFLWSFVLHVIVGVSGLFLPTI